MTTHYELKKPVTVSGNIVRSVEIREPSFGELLEVGIPAETATPTEKLRGFSVYVSRCTGLPEDVVQEMSMSDALHIVGVVAGFFEQMA
jgi:hypothetical protein